MKKAKLRQSETYNYQYSKRTKMKEFTELQPGKTYRTSGGHIAEIYAIKGNSPYNVMGAYKAKGNENRWEPANWSLQGTNAISNHRIYDIVREYTEMTFDQAVDYMLENNCRSMELKSCQNGMTYYGFSGVGCLMNLLRKGGVKEELSFKECTQ